LPAWATAPSPVAGRVSRRDGTPRKRRARRIFGTHRWVRPPGTPYPRWRELAWWPAVELQLRHGRPAPRVIAWAATLFAGQALPSSRTLQRIAARLFAERIRQRTGDEAPAAVLAWLRRRHAIPLWYACTCQDKTLCPGPPLPLPQRRHNTRGPDGRFETESGTSRDLSGSKTERRMSALRQHSSAFRHPETGTSGVPV
jgi:hypothetical protein